MLRLIPWLLFVITFFVQASLHAEEAVYSGPQIGEKLTPFEVQGVYGEEAGKKLEWLKSDTGGPLLLIFVHEVTRPTVGVTRTLMDYAAERKKDGFKASVVFLADDLTEMTNRLQRARHAMPQSVPIAISVDGQEGPGAYGLNRNVSLTVLVARDGVVTANFALVQPSVQADAPKVFKEIVKLIGGELPKLPSEYGRMKRPVR